VHLRVKKRAAEWVGKLDGNAQLRFSIPERLSLHRLGRPRWPTQSLVPFPVRFFWLALFRDPAFSI